MDNSSVNKSNNLNTGILPKRAALYLGILAFALVLLLFLGAGQASAEDVSGDIAVDTIWASDNVYNVTGDVNVLSNATLTIEDNVTVVFQGNYYLNVYGEMVVEGTADNWVNFTYNYSLAGYWGGVSYNNGSTGSVDYANFDSVWTALYFGNVSVPCSNVNINNTFYGMYYEYWGPTKSVSLTLSNITIYDAFEALVVYNYNGSVALTLDTVSIDNAFEVAYLNAYNDVGTGTIDLTILDSWFNDTVYGIYANADIIGDVVVTDSEFSFFYGDYVLWLMADSGDMAITFDGVIFDNVNSGLYAYVEFGNIDLTITDSSLSGMGGMADLTVNSNTLDNGFITLSVTSSQFSEAGFGIKTWSEELVLLAMTDNEFINITGAALYFDVRTATSTDDVLSLTFTNVTMVNVGTGLFVYVNDASLDLDLVGVHFDTNNFGVQAEVSSVLSEEMSTIDMVITDSVIEGGMYGVFATTVNGGSVVISGSEFLGQSEIAYNFDSVYGAVDVEIVDSVFDGSSSESAGTVYTIEQIEADFDLYGRTHAWDGIYFGGSEWVDLPFTFEYNGWEQTEVLFSEDGYLDFGPGSSIRPIGNADLVYYDDHFFGYIIAEDESYVLFNWYAMNDNSGDGESNSFQVILYANGEIQFNFAAMDGYGGSNAWGLLNSDFPNIDYNMYQLFGTQVWYMDWTSFLFGPHDISRGMGILVRSEVGDIDFVLNNNTITSYYRGGVYTETADGDMVFSATENSVSYMYADSDLFGQTGVIVARAYNGTINANIVNNTFLRLWSPAVFASAVDYVGGAHTFEVTGNEFIKTFYGVFTYVDIYEGIWDGPTNDTLSVVANFQNNTMTDSFGLANQVYVFQWDQENWNISVEQTFTGNVMTEEWYEGAYPLQDWMGYPGSMIIAGLEIYDEWDVDEYVDLVDATSLTVEHQVTITDNEFEQMVDGDNGIMIDSEIYKALGDVTSVCTITVTDNVMTVNDGDGVDVEISLEAAYGTATSDTSVVIEDNQITDLDWDITAIEVSIDGFSEWEEELALDMNAITFVSITGNVIEGAYEGIDVQIEYDQDNTVGDWNVSATVHLDGNTLSNVTYGINGEIYGGVWFDENYWPLYDEVAIGNFVMDYLLTIDDNVVYSIWGDEDWSGDAIFYVETGYWAEVDPSTHFTVANAMVNGVISVSGNDVTQEDGDLTLLYIYNWYGAMKTGVMDITVDVAVEDNVYEVVYGEDYYGWYADFGMYLEDYVYLEGNYDIATDEPVVWADVSWSVTGNELTGPMDNGIAMIQGTDISSPDCKLMQAFSVDISGNTIDGATEGGLGYVLDRDEGTNGYVELNVDVTIEDNTIMMASMDLLTRRLDYTGLMVGFGNVATGDEVDVDGQNITIDVLVSGNTISGAEIGMSLAREFEEDDDFLPLESGMDVFEVNFVVENNYISNCIYGIYAYGGEMTLRNNIIVDCEYGIAWDYANGEVVGNTITAIYGIDIYYPGTILVQNNDVSYVDDGVYVYGWDGDYTDVQILNNTLTCTEAMSEFMGWGDGVELYETGNVLISGNIISDSYWGIYVDGCYNLTVSNNQVLRSAGVGLEAYWVDTGWIESNVFSNGGNGIYIGDGCIHIVIGNNTIANNLGYGILIEEDEFSVYDVILYNNNIMDNGEYGVDIDAYDTDSVWYVDGDSTVSRNGMNFNGDIVVLAGGSLMIEDVHEFEVNTFIRVNEGGLFSASNTNFYAWDQGSIDVMGTFWANVCLFDGFNIYLGPTSEAEIRAGAIMNYDYAGVHVDGSAPIIADNLIFSFDAKYGILVSGEGAAPSIVSNIIALNDQGVYASGTDMGGVYDNLILLNSQSGILAEDATGKIHDNILLANKIEILLRNSNVSVEDNEIGYTNLFQVLANYAPLLGHFMSSSSETSEAEVTSEDPLATLGAVLGIADFNPYDLATWIKGHNGIWAEDSVVRTSGNVYGILNYALYSVRSEIHFADDVETIELVVPHVSEGVTYNYSLNIYVMNGIYASGSQVWVDGSTIEVLDDGLMLDNSEAWIEGATLVAGDCDYFLYNGAEVYNIATTYGKAKVEDSHSLNEGTWLTLHAVDEGDPAANVSVVIKNAKGDIVYQGVTDAEGKIRVLLIQYSITSQGKDDGFNPYTINATFESGEESMDVTLNESYMDVTIEGEEESDMGAILAVIGVLVIILLIVAAVVVMRRRK